MGVKFCWHGKISGHGICLKADARGGGRSGTWGAGRGYVLPVSSPKCCSARPARRGRRRRAVQRDGRHCLSASEFGGLPAHRPPPERFRTRGCPAWGSQRASRGRRHRRRFPGGPESERQRGGRADGGRANLPHLSGAGGEGAARRIGRQAVSRRGRPVGNLGSAAYLLKAGTDGRFCGRP